MFASPKAAKIWVSMYWEPSAEARVFPVSEPREDSTAAGVPFAQSLKRGARVADRAQQVLREWNKRTLFDRA
jgi:hypothetical protein